MRLRWDYLFWGIFFFGVFFFNPLLEAVGPERITIIICVGLGGIAAVKSAEYLTEGKRCRCCEDKEEDE